MRHNCFIRWSEKKKKKKKKEKTWEGINLINFDGLNMFNANEKITSKILNVLLYYYNHQDLLLTFVKLQYHYDYVSFLLNWKTFWHIQYSWRQAISSVHVTFESNYKLLKFPSLNFSLLNYQSSLHERANRSPVTCKMFKRLHRHLRIFLLVVLPKAGWQPYNPIVFIAKKAYCSLAF